MPAAAVRSTDANTEAYAREMGLAVWKWTIDTVDYRKPSPDVIAERAAAAGPDPSSSCTTAAGTEQPRSPVPRILERLKAKGYRFEALCR